MSLRHETALAWAEDLSAAAEPRLGILEAYAMQRHPGALEYMGDDGAGLARVAAAKGRGMAGLWLMFPALLALIAPLVGFAAILGDSRGFYRMDASTSVPIAGVCFALAALVQGVAIVWWLRSRRERHGTLLGLAVGTVVFGGLSWWVMGTASSLDGYPGAYGWRVPGLVATVLGVVFTVLLFALGRRPAPEAPKMDNGEALRAVLGAIPADERDRIRADRDAAIALLVERRRLPVDIGERARSTELGALHRI